VRGCSSSGSILLRPVSGLFKTSWNFDLPMFEHGTPNRSCLPGESEPSSDAQGIDRNIHRVVESVFIVIFDGGESHQDRLIFHDEFDRSLGKPLQSPCIRVLFRFDLRDDSHVLMVSKKDLLPINF
jgi:hypothetical protein